MKTQNAFKVCGILTLGLLLVNLQVSIALGETNSPNTNYSDSETYIANWNAISEFMESVKTVKDLVAVRRAFGPASLSESTTKEIVPYQNQPVIIRNENKNSLMTFAGCEVKISPSKTSGEIRLNGETVKIDSTWNSERFTKNLRPYIKCDQNASHRFLFIELLVPKAEAVYALIIAGVVALLVGALILGTEGAAPGKVPGAKGLQDILNDIFKLDGYKTESLHHAIERSYYSSKSYMEAFTHSCTGPVLEALPVVGNEAKRTTFTWTVNGVEKWSGSCTDALLRGNTWAKALDFLSKKNNEDSENKKLNFKTIETRGRVNFEILPDSQTTTKKSKASK